MVTLLFLSRGLRSKEDNENNRKREKRSEIQCIDIVYSMYMLPIRQKHVFKEAIKYYDLNKN